MDEDGRLRAIVVAFNSVDRSGTLRILDGPYQDVWVRFSEETYSYPNGNFGLGKVVLITDYQLDFSRNDEEIIIKDRDCLKREGSPHSRTALFYDAL